MSKIKRVLISVSNKTAIIKFAKELTKYNVEILSTGGTSKVLKESGLDIKDVSDYTQFPEIMDGRVKTLHPIIHGGILADRNKSKHLQAMQENHIKEIDMVVVNLYPFAEAVNLNANFDTCIENIDIGGPSMVRSCAKNHKYTTIVTSPSQYEIIIKEMLNNNGCTTLLTRTKLALEAFSHTAEYDSHIARWLGKELKEEYPNKFFSTGALKQILRYGENPHQKAALYSTNSDVVSITNSKQLQGKELSYNNINDADSAFEMVCEFTEPSCAIIKHTNPCGIASGKNTYQAWQKALSCDPTSAFGGIVAFNDKVEEKCANSLGKIFLEVIIAPSYTPKALEILANKKNLRILATGKTIDKKALRITNKTIHGGILSQVHDNGTIDSQNCKVATDRAPTEQEWKNLMFAWKAVKHIKSNSIVYVKNTQTIGIGAGQTSRIDSAKIGAAKKSQTHLDSASCVVASDAFFPFADGLEECIQAGATAIIQPGGSKNDKEVIDYANKAKVTMVFTGMRHFKH